MNPSKGGDVVQTDEGIVQFSLDPVVKKPNTCGKGAGVNVQAKSLTTYFADMTVKPKWTRWGKNLLEQVIKNCVSRK